MSAEAPSKDQQPHDPYSIAVRDVLIERTRQVVLEGWTPEHDDGHGARELARAATAYVQHYFERQWLLPKNAEAYTQDWAPNCWPWDPEWWKPKDPRRDLVRAAALIVAEIERLDRYKPLRDETPEERDEDGRR